MTTQRDALSNKEQEEITKEAIDIIFNNAKMYGVEQTPELIKFGLAVFIQGVKFIPSKEVKK